jgi:cell wall-associated NlpC family hydrolase
MPKIDFHKYIGIPYKMGGRGPGDYDCYGLIRHFMALEGIDIPDYRSPDDRRLVSHIFQSELRLWTKTEVRTGAIAVFRVPGMFHCAYMINAGEFVHTWEHSGGVCIEPLLNWTGRLVGIYEYTGH